MRGQSLTRLLDVADQAVASAATLEDAGIGDLRIDTDGRTAGEVADVITAYVALPVGLRAPWGLSFGSARGRGVWHAHLRRCRRLPMLRIGALLRLA
ncbi:hypothetical protein, partial [Streptomyces thermocarboxydovorans]|uniref:hypothetical protein n=1 Tax=Streptomyces thermocarboxydovorans TaxID=59298 RepID=UPI003CD052D3